MNIATKPPVSALRFCILAAMALAACEPPHHGAPLTEGVSLDLADLRSETVSDIRYDFALRIPAQRTRPVEGTVEIRFRWDDPLRRPLVVDFVNPAERVRSLEVNGDSVDWGIREDHVVIPAGRLQRGVINRITMAFQAGDEALNRNDDFLYTLFVPDRAHFSLPLFDQPDLKARYLLTLEIPASWTAIANGPLEEEARGSWTGEPSDEVRTLRFGETEPISTYLFAFVAGDFQEETAERDGREMRFLHRETDREKVERNLDALFDLHAGALDFMEEYTGIPYPFQDFGFVAIPSFQYGGMEHPGQILYRASRLFLDETATQNDFLSRASVIAHETAHMWFGDLVTMAWFDDVWTKEVFANFFAAKIVHPAFPEVNHDLRFFLAHHPTAYGVDRTEGANPIRQPLENLREAGTLYGAIIYQKAPVVMRQLELLVGEEVFQQGMRQYLERYSYDNATWPDLIEILDRLSDEELAAWSETWVEEPGRPTVTAFTVADAEDTVMTELALIQEDVTGRGRLWPQLLRVLQGYGTDSLVAVDVRLLDHSEPVPGAAGAPRPDFILPDASGIGYGHLHLDEQSRSFLLERLPQLEDPLVRGVALVTLWDGLVAGEVDPGAFLDLLLNMTELERNELNLERALDYLGPTFWRYLSPTERERRAGEVEGALWEGVLEARSPTVQGAFFSAYRNAVSTSDGVRLLSLLWSGERSVPGLALSESDRTAMALGLAVREADGWRDILDRQEEAIENPDRKARFRFLRPAVDPDPGVREEFFRSLLEPENREREPWALAGQGYLHHPLRAPWSLALVRPSLEEVWEIQRTGDIFFPKRWLDATLDGHGSAEAADTVQAFLDGLPDEYPRRLRAKVLQSAHGLFRAAAIVHGWEPE